MSSTVQALKFTELVIRCIPWKLADRMAVLLAQLFCRFSKGGRINILNNLQHNFHDQQARPVGLKRYITHTFVTYGRTMLDFLRLGFISADDFNVEMHGIENLDKALEHGRGCVLLTMHIGNWDYAGSYLATRGVPMSALVEETEPEMYQFYTKHRERLGMKTFPLSKAGFAFLHTIKNNRVLAVLGDRDILKNGVTVDFFDGRRNIPRGLGDIVIRRKLPVLFGYMVLHPKRGQYRYLGVIEPPVFFRGTIEEFNRTMVAKFEEFISQYPDQWMLFKSDWVA
jgi:KDO2-lipid IV(A) lauroyltransferase